MGEIGILGESGILLERGGIMGAAMHDPDSTVGKFNFTAKLQKTLPLPEDTSLAIANDIVKQDKESLA